ncbi:MAG: bifunctional 5,10-methylenetetrahydrofolate dehydrogenase/5,10-methenyltetrahydrofolate cyclohydrolase [Armatimonadetes bacterium]|nr:bifunctional 5,10-methylenetetrahydrofolate dehydrogenase/5,10-methenyltetrahydrofolate cyclohydrolase [Armatimonadota bacterium]
MSATILDGKTIAKKLRAELAERIAALPRPPRLVAIMAGGDEGADSYVRIQRKTAGQVGIDYELRELEADADQAAVLAAVEEANRDDAVDGVILLTPLPEGVDTRAVQAAIAPAKDVDGVSPHNLGLTTQGDDTFAPNTALAALHMVEESGVEIRGAEAVVVGRSVIVGKPAALMLLDRGATITICRTTTRDVAFHTSRADILIAAAGSPGLIRGDQIKPGAVVIDVATNWVDDGGGKGRFVGDVVFDEAVEVAGAITPVPGGVGPVTVTMLMRSVYEAMLARQGGE